MSSLCTQAAARQLVTNEIYSNVHLSFFQQKKPAKSLKPAAKSSIFPNFAKLHHKRIVAVL